MVSRTGSESAAHHLTAKLRAIVPDLSISLHNRLLCYHIHAYRAALWTSLRAAALVLSSVGMAVQIGR